MGCGGSKEESAVDAKSVELKVADPTKAAEPKPSGRKSVKAADARKSVKAWSLIGP